MVRTLVLGLLKRSPAHGYGIRHELKMQRTELWANILPNSIYNALRKMERDGMVCVDAVSDSDVRGKQIFKATQAGLDALPELVRNGLSRFDRAYPSSLYVALNFLDELPEETARAALAEHLAVLKYERAVWERGRAIKITAATQPDITNALFDNGIAHIDADLRFIEMLLERFCPLMEAARMANPTRDGNEEEGKYT